LVATRKLEPAAISIPSATALDRDWGTDTLRKGLEDGLDVAEILAQWEPGTRAFAKLREPHLIY
jgi:uncharacterized protein YbbC (DUF1343 family)